MQGLFKCSFEGCFSEAVVIVNGAGACVERADLDWVMDRALGAVLREIRHQLALEAGARRDG